MLSAKDIEKFRTDGYLLVPKFLAEVDVESLRMECSKIVEALDPAEHKCVFHPGEPSSHISDEYFFTSGDKIRFFFETTALDEHGNLKYSKQQSLNKIGHALHWLNGEFKKVTFSDKVKSLVRSLGMIDPAIIHSMYIFKSSKIGTEVFAHQDATYLYCEPPNKVIGLWIALEDATDDNGCLEFIPGSHNESVLRRSVRTETPDGHCKLTDTGPQVKYDDTKFSAVPAKKGDLILIDGRVVHKSKANTSDKDRPIYTFHILDTHESKFSELNWIQPSKDLPFTPVYTTDI